MNILWKDWCWSWNSNTWPPHVKNWLTWKDPDPGKDWRREEKGTIEDEMVGWHHWLNGHEFKYTQGVGNDREAWCSAVQLFFFLKQHILKTSWWYGKSIGVGMWKSRFQMWSVIFIHKWLLWAPSFFHFFTGVDDKNCPPYLPGLFGG